MSAQTELIAKLGEIFQTDRADLDFGIYKILGSRAKEINGYLSQTLPAQIKSALQNNEEHENRVYNHLLAFFSRYYDAGDFISQRRYGGKDRYAIPYNGEEVMLHWANKDQYYTKSGENFSNYRFTLSDGKSVQFKLVQADTAKDNQKDNEQARLFVLASPKALAAAAARLARADAAARRVRPGSQDASSPPVGRCHHAHPPANRPLWQGRGRDCRTGQDSLFQPSLRRRSPAVSFACS